jgi:hypothetical protein
MDMNCCEGIFRVSVDVYLYACSDLECAHEGDNLSLFCKSPNWQQTNLNNLVQSHHHITGKAAAICEIVNV